MRRRLHSDPHGLQSREGTLRGDSQERHKSFVYPLKLEGPPRGGVTFERRHTDV